MLVPIIIVGKAARQIPYSRLTKTPIIEDWPDIASSDPKQLALWSLLYPRAVPGVLCDSWTVLDVDNLDWLHEHEHLLPPTFNYRTSRGRHFYFERVPQLKSSTGKIAPKVDVKTGRAGVIYWPHINGLSPVEQLLALFPGWLLDLAATSSPPASPSGGVAAFLQNRGDDGPLVASPERRLPKPLYYELVRLVPVGGNVTAHDQRRARGALSMLIEKCAGEGRNAALNWSAFVVFRELIASDVVTRAAAESLLFDAATMNGYVAKDGEAATLATIRSGLGADPNTGGPSSPFDEGPEA